MCAVFLVAVTNERKSTRSTLYILMSSKVPMIPTSSDDLTDVDIMKLIAAMSDGKQQEQDIDPDIYRVFFSAIFDA